MDVQIDTSMMRIETDRLLMRPFEEGDLNDFYAYASVPGVGEMAGWPHHENIEDSRGVLDGFVRGGTELAIWHKGDRKVIGSFGFHRSWANDDERLTGFNNQIDVIQSWPSMLTQTERYINQLQLPCWPSKLNGVRFLLGMK